MKRLLSFVLALAMILSSLTNVTVYANEKEGDFEVLSSGLIKDETLPKKADDNEEVEVPSWNLKRAILLLNEAITTTQIDANKEIVDNTPVTRRMIRRVAHLSPEQCGAHDLKEWQIKVNSAIGLEYAENMTWLSLVYQNLNDFTPIKDCVKLKHLDIRDCSKDGVKIEDISFLNKLTELDFLNIKAARPKDLSPLKKLTKLTYLDMESTKIENADFVKDLKDLEYFNAQFSFVKDLKAFENHTKLQTLLLSAPANKYIHGKELLTDISPVSTLTNLKELDIANHNVKDISALKGLKNLEVFTASNNLIEDLEVLLTLPKLNKVWVQGNTAYPGFETSENTYKEAKKIFNSLSKKVLTKDDLNTLEKLNNESDGVKAFFKKTTLETLKEYAEDLKTKDSVLNKAFENIGVDPLDPETPTDPEVKEKKIIEVIPSGEFTLEKGNDPKTVLPKTVKVKLADAGVITKDEEAKIGTFRRNFKDGLEFGPISIAYKVVDENGNILSSKDYPNLIKVVDKDELGVEYPFISVGDYFEYITEDTNRAFNIEINSNKFEIDGVYSFKQEPCPIHKEGTVGEVIANENKANRHEANKNPELFYVIHVKEKAQAENPKLGINNVGEARTNETITYKVVDSKGNIISAKDNPNLFYARNKDSNTDYDKYPKTDGDYYTIESAGESIDYELKLKSDEYDLVGTYEFGTKYNMTTSAGSISMVYNSNSTPKYYKLPGSNPGEDVFIIKVKAKGEDPGQEPTPDPNPDPGENPNPESSEGLGYVDGKVVFRLVDDKGNKLKASEVANDIKIVLDEFKNLEVDGDLFSHKFSSMTEKYNPLTIKSEKYELVSQNGFEGNFSYIDYGAHLNKVYLNGEEVDVINNDTSKLDAKYFTIIVKEKETSKPDPSEKLGYVDGKVVFKLVDEKGNQLKASEVANDIKIVLDEFKNLEVDGDLFSHKFSSMTEKYNPLTIKSEKYELVSQNGFEGNFSYIDYGAHLNKVYLNGEEVDVINNDTSKLDAKYFTIVVKEKSSGGETPVEPKPEDPSTGFKYVEGSTPGVGKDIKGHEFITFKVLDEGGNQVSAKNYPDMLLTRGEQTGQDPLKVKANEDNFTFNTGYMVDNKYTLVINPTSVFELDGEYKFTVKNDASAGWKDTITTVENTNAGDKTYYKVHEDELNENVFTIHVKAKQEEGLGLNIKSQNLMNFVSLSALPFNTPGALEGDLKDLKVEWDLTNVKDEVGKYEIEGTVILEEGIVNPQELKAKAVLNVVEKPAQNNMDVTIIVTKNNLPFTEELNFNFKDLATNEVKTVKSANGMIKANLEVGHKYELTLDSEDKTIDKITFTIKEEMGPIIEGSGEVLATIEIKDKVAEKEVFATFIVQENNAPYTKELNFSFKDVETGKVTTVDSENAMVNVFLTIGHKYEISLNSEEKTMKPVTIVVGEEYPTLIDSEEPFTNITVEPKKEQDPIEEGKALDKLIVRVLKDGKAEANYQISLIYFDEFGIPNTVLKPKTDKNGEIVIDKLLANGKYQLRPARNANELKFEKDVFEFTTDKNGKVVTIDGKEIKDESEGVITFKGTEPDSDVFEKFDVNFKAVDKDGNPIEGVNFSIMTLAPRFKTLQKVDSDANGNIKFNVEGQKGGKDYSVTISKMAQFMYESEPHSIEFKLDEKGNIKVLDSEEKYGMTFTVFVNDQTHIYDEFKMLYEKAINYLKNQKFEDSEEARMAIKNLEDVIEASKKEIEETIPIYAEGKIEQLKKAMAELKKYEVKEETDPTPGTDPIPGPNPGTKPDPKPEVKPEPKPEEKPEKNIFDGIEKERQAGDDRYKTAVEISKKNFERAETVILVNGEKEADALAASVLAKEKNAPILLIKKDMTPDEVAKEIERLGAKNIILIGGLNSIQEKAVENLKQNITRIAGKDRFETAVEIAKAAGKTEKLILANGISLVDALTASSLAQVENRGIILVNKEEIPKVAKELVEKAKDILIVGGENSVKLGVKADRISGKDRFETAVKIAERAFTEPKQIALANSTAYADALVFGGVTGKVEAPILLTNKDKLPQVVKEYLERNKIEKIFVLGGENSVSENLFK